MNFLKNFSEFLRSVKILQKNFTKNEIGEKVPHPENERNLQAYIFRQNTSEKVDGVVIAREKIIMYVDGSENIVRGNSIIDGEKKYEIVSVASVYEGEKIIYKSAELGLSRK